MKINKILLSDDCDITYTDLIEFERDTTEDEVWEVIETCKNDLPGEYTNEDIYNYLDNAIGIKNITFLGNYKQFEY